MSAADSKSPSTPRTVPGKSVILNGKPYTPRHPAPGEVERMLRIAEQTRPWLDRKTP